MVENAIFSPEELVDEIILTMVDGVGSLTIRRLYEHFGDAASILSASSEALQAVGGIGPKIAAQIAAARETCCPDGLIELCRREKIDLISLRDSRYPELLKTIYDPPPILYLKGTLDQRDALALAVVGTRRMSPYGRKQTTRLAGELAKYGITIVSGLAKGIDGVAHRAALAAGGRTLAVLGGGLLRMYPKEHAGLAEEIAENGAVISEYHPLMEPNKGTFPQRNRIVTGMSLGVLVVEAPKKSGAMITARCAYEQGREVFAVPGSLDSENSRGCLQLIADGAKLTESVDDILESLGPLLKPIVSPTASPTAPSTIDARLRSPRDLQLNEIEEQILQAVGTAATALESIVERTRLSQHQVVAALFVLERMELVRRLESPDRFARV